MVCCLVVGLVVGYFIGRNVGLGVVCDQAAPLCELGRVDGNVYRLRPKRAE
ncbi:hypothetical protein [Acaryochloris marina]|uniref:Uncharacterized protein n=1 Tax=Acaryochloris marina (strain MBIC 11017) TaxID=329726 RepID=A8ZPA0_ACAM1|nr:hypothetical protein [Acaryochloris marina]ABW32836.1 hypothetical protein AM1_E0066 [Acaryochloris marina MBIC11017]